MNKKYLYCPTCKNRPDKILERYAGELQETRKWDGDCYELVESNIDSMALTQHCLKCDSVLVEK